MTTKTQISVGTLNWRPLLLKWFIFIYDKSMKHKLPNENVIKYFSKARMNLNVKIANCEFSDLISFIIFCILNDK